MGGDIDNYAFYNCPKLKKITLPDVITRIGDYAFYGTSIEEAEISIFCDWIGEKAFPDNTIIKRSQEYENIIAAGTAGDLHSLTLQKGEGKSSENTCYNKFYHTNFYNDTAFWKLTKDGTLLIWGTKLAVGFIGSRVPWGCYKDQIKKIIYNDDKVGKIINEEANKNKCNTYAIYSSKPIEEIMNNRIQEISGQQLQDCREGNTCGMENLETIIVNKGIKEIGESAFNAYEIANRPKDIYISKYVEKLGNKQLIYTGIDDYVEKNIHLEVSFDDYVKNNYDYGELVEENGFRTKIDDFSNKGNIINNINECYISINDETIPKTKEVDGKTLYLYDVYSSNGEENSNISIPNDENDYYVQELSKPNAIPVKIDKTENNFEIVLNKKEEIENPQTSNNFIMILILISSLVIILYYNKKRERLS